MDALLEGSEFDTVHRISLVKYAFERTAFDVDWDAVADEAEYKQKLFYLYYYGTGRQ